MIHQTGEQIAEVPFPITQEEVVYVPIVEEEQIVDIQRPREQDEIVQVQKSSPRSAVSSRQLSRWATRRLPTGWAAA